MTVKTIVIVALGLLTSAGALAAKQHIETGADAEVSFDGLHRVKRSLADAAWVRPDLDLSRYSKVMLRSAGVAYRAVDWKGSSSAAIRRGETDFVISEENRERLAGLLLEELEEELARSQRYSLTDQPGEDVLLLVTGLIDVVSHVPPEQAGFNRTYLRSIGEATLVIELRDSLTGAILARAADRRAAGSGTFREASSVSSRAGVAQMVHSWGALMRRSLDTVVAVSEEGDFVAPKR